MVPPVVANESCVFNKIERSYWCPKRALLTAWTSPEPIPGPDRPPLTTRDDIPKEALPDNKAAKADYQKSLAGLAGARKTLTQATATKLPSMSMESLRQQIAKKNTVNCN